ncbi:flavin reductase family protein [Streptomyces luteolifulvus]|uniref:Flavin reductase family protein n=1 Tax=Streptomyces luteolifulvus TaxID=2615112 RepID=A0A6H9UZ30_9ACTN|nr:flavin reductase family protein [Streptomyces luteolifulvus]KAB1145066.1 flavin reductase family protein [Streptomyces luteolifulvus]
MRVHTEQTSEGSRLEPAQLRHVLGHFCTGIAVITAREDGREPVGFTCQSFVSLSLAPPLVSFSVSRFSRSWPGIRRAGRFCANILSAGQEQLCRRFAATDGDRFAGVEWRASPATGSPRLAGALAWVDCTIEAVYPGGDHRIAVGRVQDLGVTPDEPDPLLFYLARYHRAAPTTPNGPAPTP